MDGFAIEDNRPKMAWLCAVMSFVVFSKDVPGGSYNRLKDRCNGKRYFSEQEKGRKLNLSSL